MNAEMKQLTQASWWKSFGYKAESLKFITKALERGRLNEPCCR